MGIHYARLCHNFSTNQFRLYLFSELEFCEYYYFFNTLQGKMPDHYILIAIFGLIVLLYRQITHHKEKKR